MESKITIKHFLNTNLKPFVINGKNYYSIYILITAKRKTTKLKSLEFSEYYTKEDFNDIFNSDNEDDNTIIKNETTSFINIAKLIIDSIEDFSPAFFTAYLSFSNNITFWEIPLEDITPFKKDNILKLDLSQLYSNIQGEKYITEKTVFQLYNNENQTKALNYIKQNGIENPKEILNDINQIIFYCSLEKFRWFVEGSKKNISIKNKHIFLFENYNSILINKLSKKYNKG